jgi:aryl-alcohol dehydrogenase-like predicted oxidoreductase
MADTASGALSLGGVPMVSRSLGRTDLLVSPIGLGTTKLGRNTDVKYPNAFPIPSDSQVHALLETFQWTGC